MIRRFKNIFAVAIAATALMSSTLVSAQGGFQGNKAIIGIDIGDSGELIIRFDSNLGCGSPYVKISRNQYYYSDMYAMALTAQASSKLLNVYVSGCEGEYSRVARMVSGLVF